MSLAAEGRDLEDLHLESLAVRRRIGGGISHHAAVQRLAQWGVRGVNIDIQAVRGFARAE